MADYERECQVARGITREAAALVARWYDQGAEVEWKGEDDPVTTADREANDLILDRLRHHFPSDAVLSEESHDDLQRLEADRVWIVDPLDGTKDFVTRTGDFVVMVGMAVRGQPVAGAVCRPLDGCLWYASEGRGAFQLTPGQAPVRLSVSEVTDPAAMSLVVTRSHRFPLLERAMEALGITQERPLGSVGLKVSALSCRLADLYLHLSLGIKEWDTCAPEVILTEAGGTLSDCFGRPLRYNQRDVKRRQGIVASNGRAHAAIIQTLEPLAQEAFGVGEPS